MFNRTLKTNLEPCWPLKSNLELPWPHFVCHVILSCFRDSQRPDVRTLVKFGTIRTEDQSNEKTSVRENTYVRNGTVEYAHWEFNGTFGNKTKPMRSWLRTEVCLCFHYTTTHRQYDATCDSINKYHPLWDGCPVPYSFGCQRDEPLVSLVTTNRIINVSGFLVVVMLLIYAVLHCLYSVEYWLLLPLQQRILRRHIYIEDSSSIWVGMTSAKTDIWCWDAITFVGARNLNLIYHVTWMLLHWPKWRSCIK